MRTGNKKCKIAFINIQKSDIDLSQEIGFFNEEANSRGTRFLRPSCGQVLFSLPHSPAVPLDRLQCSHKVWDAISSTIKKESS